MHLINFVAIIIKVIVRKIKIVVVWNYLPVSTLYNSYRNSWEWYLISLKTVKPIYISDVGRIYKTSISRNFSMGKNELIMDHCCLTH